ncbi:N-carbamoyl-D-amino-acid hydrolase [Elioraea tepida]|uniref:N-carbamoyl-D-amino-acid hydrolase n=1 Tax=Elioraea tepida TaxID=2843330 RepID=A0A975U0I6_9PROT|nr:N-carbamoyl-D-amino-acid hydrolase [Elioraea tepida]QXM23985.1 N-carbamoyl-D-amino-acid hydrolase [Elioraea tepida]
MARIVRVAACQMGPVQRADPREATLARLIALLEKAAAEGARLAVFPELALTTFFPRWPIEDEAELLSYFEPEMPNPNVQPLFDRARALGVGFYLGYAELDRGAFDDGPGGDGAVRRRGYNSAVLVAPDGTILGKYRKVHLPGSERVRPGQRWQQLEKRYFAYGDLGFPAFRTEAPIGPGIMGMLICNDRRWPEAWRCLGLQGAEMVLVGYNSAAYDPNGGEGESAALRTFHSTLVAQANAYMNATWAVAVAKAGEEDGAGLIGGSCIVDPNGQVVAQATTLGDEVLVADCDLDATRQGKTKMFDFAAHRRPQHYRRIVDQVGVVPPS